MWVEKHEGDDDSTKTNLSIYILSTFDNDSDEPHLRAIFASLDHAFKTAANDYGDSCADDPSLPQCFGWELAEPWRMLDFRPEADFEVCDWHGVVDGVVWYRIEHRDLYAYALPDLGMSATWNPTVFMQFMRDGEREPSGV